MSSLEKRHTGRHGGSHGHRKCSDGFSDTSSVGSLMDETDREVSNLTDRAFRSLCIGEDAIYNDLEVSSPTECYTAFVQEREQNKDLKLTHQHKDGRMSEFTSTFQHSYQDVAQEQGLRDESLAYISNGSIEVTHQQRRSSSRVSSFVKAFSDNGAHEVQQLKDKYKDESWDKSALLSIQQELSEFSSTYHQNFKSYGSNYHKETSLMTSSKIKFKSLNYTNFFCHSEFSPFQLWKDYNRFPFEREQVLGFSDFPRWYNSPLYKELTASQIISASPFERRQLDQKQIKDIASSHHFRSMVIQKASAIEKRCESELASNCPPWKRNNNLVRNKLPSNRPSTVSPTNEKARRPDSSLLYCSKNTNDVQQQVRNVNSSEISNSSTPFSITQLLTPVIHKRQDTETSEILQLAHTPLIPDYSFQRESDRKSLPDFKQMRDLNSYKSKAPSLLFNIKDNRKRVKSTYSPPKFGLDLSDKNKQSSKLEALEHKLTDTAQPKGKHQEQSVEPDPSGNCNFVQHAAENTDYANRTCNTVALISHYGPSKQDSQNNSVNPDKLSNKQNDRYIYERQIKSPLANSSGNLDTGRAVDYLGSGIQNNFFNEHSNKQILASMSEKHFFSKREETVYQNLKEGNDLRKQGNFGYKKHQVTEEKLSEQEMRPVVTPSKESFKGEIAALIEIDKQRKATAKQYLPCVNDTYTMKKETYNNKVNESVNKGCLSKLNEVQEPGSCFQKNSSANIQNNYLKGNPTSFYGQNNGQNRAPLSKDVSHTTCMEDKHQMNEGAITYQPYKYDPNKKWYIETNDSRHKTNESGVPKENILEQPFKTSSTPNLLKTSYILQQSTTNSVNISQRNVKESVRTEEQKQEKDKNIHTVQNTKASIKSFQINEGRFNINDILFIRDNEQAKRLQEKTSPNASVSDPTKLQYLTSPVLSDISDNSAAVSKIKQEQTPQDQNSHFKPENAIISPANIPRFLHSSNDELLKINAGIKDMLRKDRENDKMSRRGRGQTKQEILTSKLKAHAQKEISAIKEKELAKQNIPSKNHVKQSTTENNEKGQINQIAAEKLNHLFQDITCSNVSLNNDKTSLKTESLHSEVKLSSIHRKSPCVVPVIDKYKNKEDEIDIGNDQSQNQATECAQGEVTLAEIKIYQVQKNDQPHVQSNENLLSTSSRYSQKEISSHVTLKDKPLVSYSVPNFISKENHAANIEDQTSNLSKINSANNTEHLTSTTKTIDSPKQETFVTPLTSHKQPHNTLEQAKHMDQNICQINVKPDSNSNTEITTVTEKTLKLESQSNTTKETPRSLTTAKQHEIIKSPSGWTKSKDEKEAPASVMPLYACAAITSAQQTKHTTNPIKHIEEFTSNDNDHISYNQGKDSSKINAPEVSDQVYGKNNPQHNIQEPPMDNTAKTNEGCFVQQPEKHENKELGYKTSKSYMEEKLPSSDENRYPLPREVKIKDYEAAKNSHSLNLKDKDAKDSNDQTKKSNTSSQLQQEIPKDGTNQHEKRENTSTEEQQSKKDSIEINRSIIEPMMTENMELGETISTQNTNDQHVSSTDSDTSADMVKPESESRVTHIASKEDSAQNEPIIYNICVSSKTNDIVEDEPVIFSISISSLSDTSMTQDSIKQSTMSVGQTSLSEEHAEKKEVMVDSIDKKGREAEKLLKKQKQTEQENVDGIKEETQKECLENKSNGRKIETKQESMKKICDSPASKSKPDNQSIEVNSIGSAYERLLVKYGLQNSEIGKSEQDQDHTHANIKEKPTHNPSPNLPNPTRNDHESRKKLLMSADTYTKHSKELRKSSSPKEETAVLKQRENIKEYVMPLMEKYHTVNSDGEGMRRAVGEMEKQQNKKELKAGNKTNDIDMLLNKTVLTRAPTSKDNLNIHSTVASKLATTKDNVQSDENKQVRKEEHTIQTRLKANGNERALHKNVKSESVQSVKCKNDKQLLPGINPSDTSESCTLNDNNSFHNSNSKISVTVPEETKNKPRSQDKQVQDVPLVQNSQISSNQKITTDLKLQCKQQEECAKYVVKSEKPKKDPDLTKDNKASHNNRIDIVSNKQFLEHEPSKSITSKEKTHKNGHYTIAYKQAKGTSNEDVIKNVSKVAKNTDQGLLPVLKIDKHVLQNSSVSVQNKINSPRKNESEIATPITSKTKERTETLENEKLKGEESNNEKIDISTVNNDNALNVLALNKTENVTKSEFSKMVNRKETIAKPQEENKTCYDQPPRTKTDQGRKDTGQRAEVGAKKDEHSTNGNVYQYHPLKGFIPEIKENRHESTESKVSTKQSNHDTLLKKQDGSPIKTKHTQNERKATKPEISALADYARLKVISAETDRNTEKDILQKMNTNQKYNLSVGEPQNLSSEQLKKTTTNQYENKSKTAMPLESDKGHNPMFKRDKIRDGLLKGHECPPKDSIIPHPKPRSLTKNPDNGNVSVENRDISRAEHVKSNTTTQSTEKHYGYPNNHKIQPNQNTHVVQNSVIEVESKNETLPKLKQPVNATTLGKDINKESSSQSLKNRMHYNTRNIKEASSAYVIPPEIRDGERTEELQYYIVNALEKEIKPKLTHEPVLLTQNIDLRKVSEIPSTGQRSNTSSPAMGKPTMFKVKDNTSKTTSVTKTVRPRFHRSLSQEHRVCSPNEVWCGAENNRIDQDHEHDPKISDKPSASMTSHRVSKAKQIQARNHLFSPGAKELKSYNKKIQMVEEDTHSVISTMSEENLAASRVILADTTSYGFDTDRRDVYARPESSCFERPESVCYERPESVCYERPGSVCYERPESACSDMRSLSKPPVVPPKTEKALRRAKKLTTRRIKKADFKMTSDTQGHTETTLIRGVSSMPSSPMEHMITQEPAEASPAISHYHIQPNYPSPAASLMAHSFPVTQRKLLQDPNSGQYFMVEMPMQVKTKTFFDPVTGKYLQLNVRQSSQSTQSTPMEVLGQSYVVYPGFLPMSVSVPSVPSLRSSSQMSAPATLQDEQSKLEAGSTEPSELENYKTEDHRNDHQYNVPMFGTNEQKMHNGNNVRLTPRRTHIITMGDLEDFAIENT